MKWQSASNIGDRFRKARLKERFGMWQGLHCGWRGEASADHEAGFHNLAVLGKDVGEIAQCKRKIVGVNQRGAMKDTARNVRALQLVRHLRILPCLIMRRLGVQEHRVDLILGAELRNDFRWLAGHDYQRTVPVTPLLIERTQRFKSKLSTKARNGRVTRQFVAAGCA